MFGGRSLGTEGGGGRRGRVVVVVDMVSRLCYIERFRLAFELSKRKMR